MSNLFKLSFVLLFTSIALAQAPTEKQDQYVRFKTKIINGGFENGTSNWSASGGTLTANTTLSNVRSGLRSGSWDATAASQTLTSSANTVSAGNAQVSCWFMTTATDYEFAAYDGTNKVVTQTIPASSVFQKITLNYALSSPGQLRARITSASNAAVLYVDDCFAGEADNVGNGNFATDWSSYTPTTNITTNTTTSGKWRRVGDSVELELGIDWTGAPSAFSTARIDLPTGFTMDSNKLLSTGTSKEPICVGSLFDPAGGTTRYIVEGTYLDSDSVSLRYAATTGSIVYQNADISNTAPFSIGNGSYIRMKCGGIPITGWNSQTFFNPSDRPLYASVDATNTSATFNTSSSSYVDVSTGVFGAKNYYGQAQSPSTTADFGMKIPSFPVGDYYFSVSANVTTTSASTTCGLRLYDGTNTIIEGSAPLNGSAIAYDQYGNINGVYKKTSSTTDTTIKLQMKSNGGGTCYVGANLGNVSITMIPLSPAFQAPILVGSVTTGSNSRAEKIDSANVIGTAGTMSSQSSSWVTVSRTSAGIYPIAFASGYYSGEPRCTVSLADSSNGLIRFLGLPSNTGGSILITNTLDTMNVDRNYTFQCMGPK